MLFLLLFRFRTPSAFEPVQYVKYGKNWIGLEYTHANKKKATLSFVLGSFNMHINSFNMHINSGFTYRPTLCR